METCKANQCIKNNSLFHEGQLSPWNDFEKCSKPIFKEGFCKRCFSKDHRFKNNNWIKDQLWKRDGIYGEPYDFPYHKTEGEKAWVQMIYKLHPHLKPKEKFVSSDEKIEEIKIIRIPNIENYTQEIIDGELILTPKKNYITEEEFNRTILLSSKILSCIVKNGEEIISNKTKYQAILTDIWKSMPTQKIVQTTSFNMKLTNEKGINGYKWSSELKMSIQRKDANHTMKEVIKMIKLNNYSIEISILLNTGKTINYKFNL